MSASTVKDNDGIGPMDLLYSSAEQVLRSVQAGLGVHVLSNFVDSVHWKEPFIFSLITMHTAIFALTYVTRKYNNVQFGILTLLTAVSIGAERLNQLGQNYWPLFATQDYFDQSGLFMLVFVCGPFVIIANFIVINMGLRLIKIYAIRKRRQGREQSEDSSSSNIATSSASAPGRNVAQEKKDS